MPNFNKTIEAAESKYEAGKSFTRLEQLVIKDGETHHFRMVSDDILSLDTHLFVLTKDKPENCTWTTWPTKMWAICPQDAQFRVADEAGNPTDVFEDGFGDCYIHKAYAGKRDPDSKFDIDISKPQVISYGLAAIRKPVFDPVTKKPIGFQDDMIEVTDEAGIVHRVPKIVIVAQRYDKLFASLKATAFLPPYSFCDKDFTVTRKGSKFTVTGHPATPDLAPGTPQWERYEKALKVSKISLEEYVTEYAQRDHYVKFWIPGETPKGGYGGGKSDSDGDAGHKGASADAEPVKPEFSEQEMADFSAKFGQRGTTPPAEDPGVQES